MVCRRSLRFLQSAGTEGFDSTSSVTSISPYKRYLGIGYYLDDSFYYGEKIDGASTYNWEWFPPLNPLGLHNDPNKSPNDPKQPFPVPPLFVLGANDPIIYADPSTDTNFSAVGAVNDGFDPNWHPTLSTSSSYGPVQVPGDSDLPRRGILSATPQSSKSQVVSALLSPFAQLSLTNAHTGYGEIYMDQHAAPMTLFLPDPFVRPDLGDANGGENQLIYSAASTALLQVPAAISTGNVYSSDLNWLINASQSPRVTWKFDAVPPAGSTTLTQYPLLGDNGYSNYTGSLTVYPNSSYLVPPARDVSHNPVIEFSGLPEDIRSFGNHTITLGVQSDPSSSSYSNSQTAYIQTFFPGVPGNYPEAANDQTLFGYVIPNWYHYYNQVFPTVGAGSHYNAIFALDDPDLSNLIGRSSQAIPDGLDSENPTGHILIRKEAYASHNMPVFDINPTTNLVRYVGILKMDGIMSYIYTAAHEQGHVNTFETFVDMDSPSGQHYHHPIITAGTAISGDAYAPSSADGDTVWDYWESQHHMDKDKSDTSGAYGVQSNDDKGDNEVVADIDALSRVFTQVDAKAWKNDWADQGINFGQPYYLQEPYNNQPLVVSQVPTFYLKFQPVVTPYPSSPNHSPVKTKDGQYYEITNLQDLKDLYPQDPNGNYHGLVISLGEL